ncbi:MAG: hypothetical protein WBC44_17860 [Planctomycetaceae bacterium]
MNDPVRKEVLTALAELSEQAPQLRFGQLIANLAYLACGPENESVWNVEDDELLAATKEHAVTLKQRSGAGDRVAG